MFFERPKSGELAVLVHMDFSHELEREDPREFEELVLSAGGDPVEYFTGQRVAPNPKYFVGSGKLAEIKAAVDQHQAGLVLFNHSLSPSQERNLEKELNCRVLDRTGLILDIFAQRARTHEGKLQVELAQLQHMSTRLVRGWTHLERQKGGIGLRGPGETQLETDRRLLRVRIKSITRRLEKVQKQRQQGRRARQRADISTISLVGYTNAGKSTLFNSVTDAEVYAADQLFATLDPTLRRLQLPDVGPVVLADTVGFIRHLPHKLVDAFKATLEEASEADLLLHVIDASDSQRLDNIEQVESVLNEIGADHIPCLQIYNKIDLLSSVEPRLDRNESGRPQAVWLSAQEGQGLEFLTNALSEWFADEILQVVLPVQIEQGRLRAKLYKLGAVQAEAYQADGGSELTLRAQKKDLLRVLNQENIDLTLAKRCDAE